VKTYRFKAFTVVKNHIEFFWVVILCSVVVNIIQCHNPEELNWKTQSSAY